MSDKKIYLSSEEVKHIELLSAKCSVFKANIAERQQATKAARVEAEKHAISKEESLTRAKLCEAEAKNLQSKLRDQQKEYTSVVNEIAEVHGITGRWGYDPETGEVKIDEEEGE